MPIVNINLTNQSYDIIIERGILSQVGELCKKAGLSGRAAVITDANISLRYSAPIIAALREAGFDPSIHLTPPGEASKSMDQATQLCRSLMERHHDQNSFVVALGGGVIGDLAGFVASIFYRGIPCVQIPTTIIAQVDSSLGGKTGVNTLEGKNLIGTFHQPSLVISDPDTLKTLPRRVFHEGFAEIIKHAAIRDAALLDELEALDPDDQCLSPELIARNVKIKARIVEEDEKESVGVRALLNFGHTIGHAIEASVPYGSLLHGEAISCGIRAALYLSEQVNGLDGGDSRRLLNLLTKFNLPLKLDDEVTDEKMLTHMLRDKSFVNGQRHMVLLERNGHATLSKKVTDELINGTLAHLRTAV